MQLSPRYDGPPILTMAGDPSAVGPALDRQRRRLLERLAALDEAEWSAPSRCAGWSVQDVAAHLVGTDGFWTLSIRSALAGEPTRVLASFDPAATPAAMVDGMRNLAPADVLDQLRANTTTMLDALADIGPDDWGRTGESPAGHVSLSLVAQHALWDGWVHERDMLAPLGRPLAEEPDEVAAVLGYVAALAPALAVSGAGPRTGSLVVHGTGPDVRVVVDAGERVHVHDGDPAVEPLELRGRSADLADQLSIRAPLEAHVAPAAAWLVAGLADVFDQPRPA